MGVAPECDTHAYENHIDQIVGAQRRSARCRARHGAGHAGHRLQERRPRPAVGRERVRPEREVGPDWVARVRSALRPGQPFPARRLQPGCAAEKLSSRLERDIFTSTDFYADKALWIDPRYYRCNSPMRPSIHAASCPQSASNTKEDKDAPWGHCEIGLSARSDRQPLRIQDGAGALRRADERDARPRRPERIHVRELPDRRVERRLRAPGRGGATQKTGTGAGTRRFRRSSRC